MARRRNDPKPKPIEEWGADEWQAAYEIVNAKHETLKKELKTLFVYLHRSLGKIQEIIN